MAQEEALYRRNPDYIFRTIVGEAVLVPIRQEVAEMDCIYTLNAVGALIWQRMETPASASAVLEAVLDEFAAEPAVVAADIARFLDGMVAIGAIRKV